MDRERVPLSVPTASSTALATLASTPPARRAGAQERDASPWLGRGSPPSRTFQAYQRLERDFSLWAGAMPDAAVAPSTVVGAFADWWASFLTPEARSPYARSSASGR